MLQRKATVLELHEPLLSEQESVLQEFIEKEHKRRIQSRSNVSTRFQQFFQNQKRLFKLPVSNDRVIESNRLLFETKEETAFSTSSNVNYDDFLRLKNTVLTVMALLGVIMMIVTNCLNYDYVNDTDIEWHSHWETYRSSLHHDSHIRNSPLYGQYVAYLVMKWLNVLVTLFCVVLLVDYYVSFSNLKRDQWNFSSGLSAFLFSSLSVKFVGELLVLLITPITPIPNLERWTSIHLKGYDFDDKIGLFMFARLYLVVRVMRDYSKVYQKRAHIIDWMAKKQQLLDNLCIKSKWDKGRITLPAPPLFGWRLTLRMMYYQSPIKTLLSLMIAIIAVCGFSVWILERDTNPGARTLSNIVWLAWETMTTMGFGDITPKSPAGRIVCIFQGVLGNMLLVFSIGVVITNFQPTGQQKSAISYFKKEKYAYKRGVQALRVLQVAWLYRKNKCTLSHKYLVTARARHHMKRFKMKIGGQEESVASEMISKLTLESKNLESQLAMVLEELQHVLELLLKRIRREQESGNPVDFTVDIGSLLDRIADATQGEFIRSDKLQIDY